MSEFNEKILSMVDVPKLEDEDIAENPDNYSSSRYDAYNILDAIKTENFKDLYFLGINDLKRKSFIIQKTFCLNIIEQIKNKYDYEFPIMYDISNNEMINNIYEFIEFLEYDCVNLLKRLWKYLNADLTKINLDKFCSDNEQKIIREIEDQIDMININEIISEFLRTYDKKNLMQFIKEKTKNFKTEILIYNLGGEL